MPRLLLITDAWDPQTNGVVTTWRRVLKELTTHLEFQVEVIHPGLFRTVPLPTYNEIQLARNPWLMKQMIAEFRPDYVHIATEGSLGVYARRLLRAAAIPYTTSLHTKFPEYVKARAGVPLNLGYMFMRWFHHPSVRTLCTTLSHKRELEKWGLSDLVVWGRGVDLERFHEQPLAARNKPRLLYVGRVAVEKNLEAFLSLQIEGTKVVVGDGPQRFSLEAKYPQVQWLGYRKGQALVDEYAQADVFVFPSLTDTFGLVMLEANACGTPVAGYPVTGPVDVVQSGVNGVLGENLGQAISQALKLSRSACRAYAEQMTWEVVVQRLQASLASVDWDRLPNRAGWLKS
ncbi:MAG: glycosyltransferase family 1 protein [Pseudomonadota bacterium]